MGEQGMTNPRLKSENLVPYGGSFVLTDPLTGLEVMGTTFESLMDRVFESRRANGKPIGVGIRQEFEALICQKYPDECENWNPSMPRKRSLTVKDVAHGSRMMLSIAMKRLTGQTYLVSREEAERRAQICLSCPFNNLFYKSCAGLCAEIKDVVSVVTAQQGTQYDKNLHACNVCGCYLVAAIWVDQKMQWDVLDEKTKTQFRNVNHPCWKVPKD